MIVLFQKVMQTIQAEKLLSFTGQIQDLEITELWI